VPNPNDASTPVACPGCDALVSGLDAAVASGDPDRITRDVKALLERLLGGGEVQLPARYFVARDDCYARRLLHRDPGGRYTAVVMTWGPGQHTAVHDHGGLWCVEGVVDGAMEVTSYRLSPHEDGSVSAVPTTTLRAGIGDAGRLIPPTDHHVLGNALDDRASVTLHVYGGDLDRCQVFVPRADGRFEAQMRALTYHA
jgi:predicted metal-dependent enzyme (double-stranded beta helix superfamily)